MSDLVTWETYATAPKAMAFKPFLYDLNLKYKTNLEILDHDKGFFRETIRFKFSGPRHAMAALQQEYKQIVLDVLEQQHKNSFYTETCNADSMVVTGEPGSLKMEIVASKKEKIHQIAQDIKNHFGIDYTISEVDNGFLRGKTVTIKVSGTAQNMELFVNTFHDYLDCKTPPVVKRQDTQHTSQSNQQPKTKKNAFSFVEDYVGPKKDSSNFVAQSCYVMSADIEYSPNHVKIDVITRNNEQNAPVHQLAESIKNHFGINYKTSNNSTGITIHVDGTDKQVQLFADTFNHHLDWKIEPTITKKAARSPGM